MAKARYIIRIANGELFGWHEAWLKIPGFVEYDPEIHGFRSEVAAQMGLTEPEVSKVIPAAHAAVAAEAAKPEVAGAKSKKATSAVEEAPQTTPAEPDLSDVFNAK